MPFSWDNYPYTNFHELNLDWFIKKFKEIFDEWDALYAEMQAWKDETDASLAEWKTVTEQDISDWEAGVISDLNDWKDAFETLFSSTFDNLTQIKTDAENARDAAQGYAQNAANSALSTSSVLQAVEDLTGNTICDDWVSGKRIDTTGTSIDLTGSGAAASASYAYQILSCNPGDIFTLSGKASNASYRLWCWCAADGTIISRPNANLTYNREIIYCPENAYALVVNVLQNESHGLYKGVYLEKRSVDNMIDPDNYPGNDNDKLVSAMDAIGNNNHGIILIKRQYTLSDNILIKHLGSSDTKLIFIGIGSNNPGFNMDRYGFKRYDGLNSYGSLSFVNILFKGASNCFMFTADNIIRVNFENCVFDGFNHIVYATRFVQSYYFNNCIIRNGTGTAFVGSSGDQAPLIDFRIINCIIERNANLLTGYGLHGVYITDSCIEGNDGYVIFARGDCTEVVVNNCYFEAQNVGYNGGADGNGVCFDFNSISGSVDNIAITNNMFGALKPGNTIIILPSNASKIMNNMVFTITNNYLSAAVSEDPEVESGAYLVYVPENAVNVYNKVVFNQNTRAKKYDPNHLIIDNKEANTNLANLLVTEYYMTHDDDDNPTTRYNPGFWFVCDDLDDLYAPGYFHISPDIPILNSPVQNEDVYLINMRTNETVVQIAITSSGIMSRIGNGSWT